MVRATALLCVVALMLAGCGSGGPSKRGLIAEANAICEATLANLRTDEAASAHVRTLVPLIAQEFTALDALARPTQDAALLTRYLNAMHAALGDWRRLAAAQRSGSAGAAAAAANALSANPAPVLAADYGIGGCAAAGGTVGSAGGGGSTSTSTSSTG